MRHNQDLQPTGAIRTQALVVSLVPLVVARLAVGR